jgi:hypothetical protein
MFPNMRLLTLVTLPLGLAGLAGPAASLAAQTSAKPVASAFREQAERMARNLIAAADDMPVAKFGFKPTPPQMSWGGVVLHVALDNEIGCAGVGGVPVPQEPKLTPADTAPQLVARLKRSFAFCHSAFASLDDSKLAEKVPFFDNSQVTRAEGMFERVDDWADHYSQMANYLRLNGILPPTARSRK